MAGGSIGLHTSWVPQSFSLEPQTDTNPLAGEPEEPSELRRVQLLMELASGRGATVEGQMKATLQNTL